MTSNSENFKGGGFGKIEWLNEDTYEKARAAQLWAADQWQHPNILDSFDFCIGRLQDMARMWDGVAVMGLDFAEKSFTWAIVKDGKVKMNGGMILHGAHDNGGDGGAPTFSVNLSPTTGWQLHT